MQDFLWTPLTGSGLDADASLAASLPRDSWWNEKKAGLEIVGISWLYNQWEFQDPKMEVR